MKYQSYVESPRPTRDVNQNVADEQDDSDFDINVTTEGSNRLADNIENCSRVMFPLVYMSFVMCYFVIYLVDGP